MIHINGKNTHLLTNKNLTSSTIINTQIEGLCMNVYNFENIFLNLHLFKSFNHPTG